MTHAINMYRRNVELHSSCLFFLFSFLGAQRARACIHNCSPSRSPILYHIAPSTGRTAIESTSGVSSRAEILSMPTRDKAFPSATPPMSPRTTKHQTHMTPAAATIGAFATTQAAAATTTNEKATNPPGSRPPRSSAEGGAARLPVMQLRDYQARIATECERANTIVVLPTGSGKTLIAAEVIKRLGPPALFLVPTCLLVKQQAIALKAWTGLRVAEYRGGKALPSSFDVLVSTPESFKMAQRSGPSSSLLHWDLFRVVIFDEVHHVLKEHPYRKLALSLRRISRSAPSTSSPSPSVHGADHPQAPRVVGLTASYTYAVGDARIEASLRSMCDELLVTKLETASPEALRDSGYHAVGAKAEVSLVPSSDIPLLLPGANGVLPPKDRKPHKMGDMFFGRERQGKNTGFTQRLMACVRAMENAVVETREHPSFSSPLPPSGTLAPREWGTYAHKMARDSKVRSKGSSAAGKGRIVRKCVRCGTSSSKDVASVGRLSPQRPQVLRPMLAELEHWYEAVKALVVSWEESEDEAATILDLGGCKRSQLRAGSASDGGLAREEGNLWPRDVQRAISEFWAEVPESFPRFDHLKQVLLEQYASHGVESGWGKNSFSGIIFVRQRVTTHVLAHVISSDPELAPLFSTACLYAASSPATASLSVSKSQGQTCIQSLREGLVNLLIATNVAEEGMDIPAANCTIRFDPMEHAVSLVQGRGRARKEDTSFIVLSEREDRTTAHLEAVEQEQLRLVRTFTPNTKEKDDARRAAAVAAQTSRERQARSVLLTAGANADSTAEASDTPHGALSVVNIFSKKTKAVLEDSWRKGAGGLWVCTLTYESGLRELHATGRAIGKKAAKKLAAANLVADLLAAIPAAR